MPRLRLFKSQVEMVEANSCPGTRSIVFGRSQRHSLESDNGPGVLDYVVVEKWDEAETDWEGDEGEHVDKLQQICGLLQNR
jgi:hypothetical protein